jgi:hypothetical protein
VIGQSIKYIFKLYFCRMRRFTLTDLPSSLSRPNFTFYCYFHICNLRL